MSTDTHSPQKQVYRYAKETLERAKRLLLVLVACMWAFAVSAEEYVTQADFLAQAFNNTTPQSKTLWLNAEQKASAKTILGHDYAGLRVRYWFADDKSAWILQEIGKERPITIGVIVKGSTIERIEILAFLESRGWEVKFPYFKKQFEGARAKSKTALDTNIDGITGATLSVRAVTKIASLALYFAEQISPQKVEKK